MSKVRIHGFSISIDGCGAGPDQNIDTPLGVGGEDLHNWMVKTDFFQKLYGDGEGTKGIDNDFTERGFANIGAWIMGRNMFGPIRGKWPDDSWKGWWGESTISLSCVCLNASSRPSITMDGGTTLHFVTEGIHVALERARTAANGKDIRIGGGVKCDSTVSSRKPH